MIIDAWGQHPALSGLAAALASMDRAGIDRMLISAWVGPRNLAIANDEIAAPYSGCEGSQGGGRGSVDQDE